MINNPFVKHSKLFYQLHSSAQTLALMVLSMYDSDAFHFPLSKIRICDPDYQKIANEIIAHFIVNGESDAEFQLIGKAVYSAYMCGEILTYIKRADRANRWLK